MAEKINFTVVPSLASVTGVFMGWYWMFQGNDKGGFTRETAKVAAEKIMKKNDLHTQVIYVESNHFLYIRKPGQDEVHAEPPPIVVPPKPKAPPPPPLPSVDEAGYI